MLTFLFLCAVGLAFAALIAIPVFLFGLLIWVITLPFRLFFGLFFGLFGLLFGLIFGIFRVVFGILGGDSWPRARAGRVADTGGPADWRRCRWTAVSAGAPRPSRAACAAGLGDLPDRLAASHPDILIISAACRELVSFLPSYFASWLFVPVGAQQPSRRRTEF